VVYPKLLYCCENDLGFVKNGLNDYGHGQEDDIWWKVSIKEQDYLKMCKKSLHKSEMSLMEYKKMSKNNSKLT